MADGMIKVTSPNAEARIASWLEQERGKEEESHIDLLCASASELAHLRIALEGMLEYLLISQHSDEPGMLIDMVKKSLAHRGGVDG